MMKATGAIGGFDNGQELSTVEQIGGYYKAVFNEDNANPTELTVEQVAAIAMSIPQNGQDDDDWELDILAAIDTGTVPGEADDDEADKASPMADDIRGLSDKAAKDTILTNLVAGVVDGQEKVDAGPVHICVRLQADWTKEERAVMPVPGSKAGNNPDWIKVPRVVDGERKEVSISRVRQFCLTQPSVMVIQDQLDAIKVRKDAKDGTDQELAKLNKRFSARKAAAIRALTRGIRVMQVFDVLSEHDHVLPLMEKESVLDPSTGKMVEQVMSTKYPLVIVNRHKQTEGNKCTVSTFIALKPMPNMTQAEVYKTAKKKGGIKTPIDKLTVTDKLLGPIMAKTVHALEKHGIWAPFMDMVRKNTDEATLTLSTVLALETLCGAILDDKTGDNRKRANAQANKDKASGNDAARNVA